MRGDGLLSPGRRRLTSTSWLVKSGPQVWRAS